MLALCLLVLAVAIPVSQAVLAKHKGHCPECHNPIFVDEPIVYDDEEDAWLHEECADGELVEAAVWGSGVDD